MDVIAGGNVGGGDADDLAVAANGGTWGAMGWVDDLVAGGDALAGADAGGDLDVLEEGSSGR